MVRITKRAIEKKDLPLLKRWRNSDSVMPYCRQYRSLSDTDMETWYNNLHKDSDYNLTNDLFIFENNNEPIGVAGLVRLDWRNRKGELSFYLGDSQNYTQEIVSSVLLQLMAYANKTLGLHKVYFPCYESNPYIKLYEKVLDYEYTAKSEYYWEGEYLDRIVLVKYFSSI